MNVNWKTESELEAMNIEDLEALQTEVDAAWDDAESEEDIELLTQFDQNIQVEIERRTYQER